MANEDRCACCGEIIPDGRQVCPSCEKAKQHKADKLAREVSQALDAGMSYGKWKALQGIAQDVQPKIPDDWKTCAYCGKVYKPHDVRQKYCDSICCRNAQSKNHRLRRKSRARENQTNKVAGE